MPIELFDADRDGEMLAALARPSLLTKAIAPALFAAGLSVGLSMQTQLLLLAMASAIALACDWMAASHRVVVPTAYESRSIE